MTSTSLRRRPIPVALVVLAMFSLSLVAVVAQARAAHAQGAGPYPGASLFRPDGALGSSPATVTLPDIGTAVFTLGTDGTIWWSTPNANWGSLGMPIVSTELIKQPIIGAPAVVSWGPGRIDVFIEAGTDPTQPGLFHKLWQDYTTCSGCAWSGWFQPVLDGTLASPPAVSSYGPGNIDVAVVGTDGNIWLREWNFQSWSGGWLNVGDTARTTTLKADPSLAGSYFPPAIVEFIPGRVDLFAWGTDNTLWQTFFINNTWQGWFQPTGTSGTLNSAPSAEWWDGDGPVNVTVFIQGTDLHLYETTYTNGAWTPWTVEGMLSNTFQGAPNVENTLQPIPLVLVRGNDNRAYVYVSS